MNGWLWATEDTVDCHHHSKPYGEWVHITFQTWKFSEVPSNLKHQNLACSSLFHLLLFLRCQTNEHRDGSVKSNKGTLPRPKEERASKQPKNIGGGKVTNGLPYTILELHRKPRGKSRSSGKHWRHQDDVGAILGRLFSFLWHLLPGELDHWRFGLAIGSPAARPGCRFGVVWSHSRPGRSSLRKPADGCHNHKHTLTTCLQVHNYLQYSMMYRS